MRRYILKRVLFLFLVIWTAATINFILPHLAGRDPIKEQLGQQIASQGRSATDAAAMEKMYKDLFGLDKPLWQQYLTYIGNVFQLKFGYSMQEYPLTVMEIIIDRSRISLPVLVVAVFLSFTGGTLLGALLGWNKTPRWVNNIFVPPLLVCGSVPAFLVALVLIYYLAFRAKLVPLGNPWDITMKENWSSMKFIASYAYHAILPIMAMTIVELSGWALGMRAMMVTVEGEDYTTFAEAKGLKSSRIFFRYLLRNALLPNLTGLAIRLGFFITGAAVAENFFAYRGIGARLGQAISVFDYFMIYGIALIMVMSIALATFFIDLIYPLLDPRITYRAQKG